MGERQPARTYRSPAIGFRQVRYRSALSSSVRVIPVIRPLSRRWNIKVPDLRSFLEHLGLKLAGNPPGRLPARRSVQGKNHTAAPKRDLLVLCAGHGLDLCPGECTVLLTFTPMPARSIPNKSA